MLVKAHRATEDGLAIQIDEKPFLKLFTATCHDNLVKGGIWTGKTNKVEATLEEDY